MLVSRFWKRKPSRVAPKLSVILCVYNMPREAPRTILSALPNHQQGIAPEDYEVIVVDNGSSSPIEEQFISALPNVVTYVRYPHATKSPVHAMNWAATEIATGEHLLFAIDGARIFSPRLFATTLSAHAAIETAFVYALSWHLGPKPQMQSVEEGYDQEFEDRLIESSGWPAAPDGLFDISVFAGSSRLGFFMPVMESNAFSMSRSLLSLIGGYDERFTSPGGGLCNLELFARYVAHPHCQKVCLLSDGTFHQVHGGIATSGVGLWDDFMAEYSAIFGRSFESPPRFTPIYFGQPRPAMDRFLKQSADGLRST